MRRIRLAAALAVGLLLFGGMGAALAVSDGNYDPARQHCSGAADNSDSASTAEPGCHNATVVVSTDSGEVAGAGTQQTADGEPVDPTKPDVWANAPSGAPSAAHVYFGADDNLDVGEHDSSSQISNGPSDGGGIQVNVDPSTLGAWLGAVMNADIPGLQTHPVPVLDAGVGACADGNCISVQTQRRVVNQGGNDNPSNARDAADYSNKDWDPESCDGSHDQPDKCGNQALSAWNAHDGTTYAEPGVQVYEDPDPQASPEITGYPLTGAYVGTCGVVAGGGEVAGVPTEAPASPVTNGAGQVDVRSGC